MSLLDRALNAAARAAWEADQHLTAWDDLAESTRDVMRNLVRVPVDAALRVALDEVEDRGLPCRACDGTGYATTWQQYPTLGACNDCGGTGTAVP